MFRNFIRRTNLNFTSILRQKAKFSLNIYKSFSSKINEENFQEENLSTTDTLKKDYQYQYDLVDENILETFFQRNQNLKSFKVVDTVKVDIKEIFINFLKSKPSNSNYKFDKEVFNLIESNYNQKLNIFI
jgi:hypothetical protein